MVEIRILLFLFVLSFPNQSFNLLKDWDSIDTIGKRTISSRKRYLIHLSINNY